MCINKKRNGMNIPVGKKKMKRRKATSPAVTGLKMKELAGDFVFLSKWR